MTKEIVKNGFSNTENVICANFLNGELTCNHYSLNFMKFFMSKSQYPDRSCSLDFLWLLYLVHILILFSQRNLIYLAKRS